MLVTQIIALIALAICFVLLFSHFIRVIRLGKPKDFSEKSGSVAKGVAYSNTIAMMPQNKESAYLHIPSYALGMLFHIGIFTSILVFLLSFFNFFNHWLCNDHFIHYLIPVVTGVGTISGICLFIKRLVNRNLRNLTNPDDFLSNGFTTLFQLATTLYLFMPACMCMVNIYYIITAILLLYMPVGKLKHLVYYFSARYHLGFFYGWRNVWPQKKDAE